MIKKIHALLTVALLAALTAAAAPADCAEFREKGTAVIGEKGPNALQFEAHGLTAFTDRYMLVSRLTRIYNEEGVSIPLSALRLPCQAEVFYKKRASDGKAEAISVNVEHYLEERETTTNWSLPTITPAPQN